MYLGENYGVGMIEKYSNGKWLAIEPVWRCDNECYLGCNVNRQLDPEEARTFYWAQTVVLCYGHQKEEELQSAGPGDYRISSVVFDQELNMYKTIYSDEFVIK